MTASGKDFPARPGRARALRYWLRLGLLSFGGPGGAIGVMHLELVERLRWVSERRFLHALNYTMVLPGPEAQQLATYVGWLLHGRLGGLAAGVLFVLPSLAMIVALAWLYLAYGEVGWVAALLSGVKPAVTAVILCAVWRIGRRALRRPLLWAIAAAAFLGLFALGLPFPLLILSAGALGVLAHRFAPGWIEAPAAAGAQADDDGAGGVALTRAQAARILALGAVLWLAVYAGARLLDGSGLLAAMAVFFSKAAVLSFGGAYAVLPYIHQVAVEQFQWVTAAQMIDGLALRELIPGPLVLIGSFVAFIGGYEAALLGAERAAAAGAAAALVAAWCTFLPSFLFIFVGAPLIERLRDRPALTAPLKVITAAVVGVMLNLAAHFAGHVVWTRGWDAPPDWGMALMTLLALLALTAGRVPMVPVLLTCAATGVLLAELGAG